MKTKLNIAEILKDCPKGTKLYSPLCGECEIDDIGIKYITVKILPKDVEPDSIMFYCDGTYLGIGECLLFPSKDNRDWSKFKKPKFDPKTFQPFDRVLVKCLNNSEWLCNIFSHIEPHSNFCFCANDTAYKIYIPYNDETKHLVGTVKEAPEYYRYWED